MKNRGSRADLVGPTSLARSMPPALRVATGPASADLGPPSMCPKYCGCHRIVLVGVARVCGARCHGALVCITKGHCHEHSFCRMWRLIAHTCRSDVWLCGLRAWPMSFGLKLPVALGSLGPSLVLALQVGVLASSIMAMRRFYCVARSFWDPTAKFPLRGAMRPCWRFSSRLANISGVRPLGLTFPSLQ